MKAGTGGLAVVLLIACWHAAGALAEEAVQALAFFDEPLELEAVPGTQRYLLVVLPAPDLTAPVYALRGKVRYEGVAGDAYLQMNNDFGDRGVFFTKGLAPTGPLGRISGTSDWRPFVLPFYANRGEQGGDQPPGEVTLELHLPISGVVALRDVSLYQYAPGEDPMAMLAFDQPETVRRVVLVLLLGALFVAALIVLIGRSRGGRTGR